jgi:hypothetical protein
MHAESTSKMAFGLGGTVAARLSFVVLTLVPQIQISGTKVLPSRAAAAAAALSMH